MTATMDVPGYEISERLFESRITLIYRAIRAQDGQSFVLKILKPQEATEELLARFRREYHLISMLDLPGVVKAYGLEEYQGSLMIVMEDIGGQSLDLWLNEAPMPLMQCLKMSIALADILGGIHRQRIIHKNVNPSNIVWNPETDQIRLIDFGIADELPQRSVGLQPPTALEGTLEYMSPEQTGRMNRSVDYRTDLYSLGVTFHRMLTGKLPFEAADALGMTHFHIAGTPVAPHVIDPRIPEMVSRIVMKLMAKMAEDRYQSAWGLIADLQRCLHEIEETGKVRHFELGLDDYSEQLQIPQKLYGRKRETEQLLAAFERASLGERELLLVAGYAGVGKTVLVHEMHKPVTEKRGYFIEGKFDQLQRDVPYFGWIQAFAGFVNYVLMENEVQLAQWRQSILKAVGSIGRVLTDVIPNLELVIGAQPAVPELGGTESQNRFNYVFLEFIKAIATSDHPLVVFLDDLQWIDLASLRLLQTLLGISGVSNILVIGAYRDNEVDAFHPLMKSIETLRKEETRIRLITLGNLSEKTVNMLIADTLRYEHPQTVPLTQLVYSKTGGNPFFTLQILRNLTERQAITFDVASRRWQWDISVLKTMEISDNVVALMLGKIKKLAPQTQQMLPLAACMGFRFNLSNLNIIAKQPEEVSLESLKPALSEGLIIPLNGNYQFVHDRVQQAAYSMIPEADRKKVHLEIGRLLRQYLPAHNHEEQIFTTVDHLNIGTELIDTTDERLELAQLNLQAGSKGMASAAFSAAARYYDAGVALLDEESWVTHYDLALQLHGLAAEAASLTGEYDRNAELFKILIRHAKGPLDMIEAYLSRLLAFTAQARTHDYLDCVLDILDRFGVHFEHYPSIEDIQRGLVEVTSVYDSESIGSLIDLPEMTDPIEIAILDIINMSAGTILSASPELYALLSFEAVKRTIKHGLTPSSASGIWSYSLVLCGMPEGNIDDGYQFGELAVRITEKFHAHKLIPRIGGMNIGVIWPFKRHLRDTILPIQPYYQMAKEVGDFEHAGYVASFFISNSYLSGKELVELERATAAYDVANRQIRAEVARQWQTTFWQAAQNLLGRSENPCVLKGEAYDIDKMLPILEKTKNQTGTTGLYVNTLILCYLFEEYENGLNASMLAEKDQGGMRGIPIYPTWLFYDSLTRLALYSRAEQPQKELFLERVAANQAILKRMAHYAPMNHLHKWHLVEAEWARVLGDRMAAIEQYHRAIALARENSFIQEEALADELAARFWSSEGREDYARLHMERAHSGYSRWQAWAKVRALEASYSYLAARPEVEPGKRALDLDTVMKTTHAISSEMEMNSLLGAVMRIVIENAGAQSGFLLLERDGEWTVAAKGKIETAEVEIPLPISIEESDVVSLGVVRFVARTKEQVVLDDAANQGQFVNDPHIRRLKTKSLLCAPLLSRGRLIGVLYLENNLTTRAFTAERVELLEMLLSQAAISLENARIYEALRDSELKYRRIVDTANEGIWVLDLNAITSSVNARMAEILDYQPEEMIGQPVTAFMFDEDWPDHDKRMEARRQGLSENYEIRFRRRDGQTVWTLASATPVFDAENNFRGSFAMLTDITERKLAEEHKREFYKRTILAATEGKLLMTDREEVERIAGPPVAVFPVRDPDDFRVIRKAVFDIAHSFGMEESRVGDLVVAVGEAVTNAIKHAGGGTASIHGLPDSVLAVISDEGPGIEAMTIPDVALARGYTTAGTLGMGYKIVISMADKVYLATGPGGTTVGIEMMLQKVISTLDLEEFARF